MTVTQLFDRTNAEACNTKTCMDCNRNRVSEILIDCNLLRINFPYLASFGDRIMREIHLHNGLAPKEILVPREFFKLKQKRAEEDIRGTLVDRVTEAFRRNGYSYYQHFDCVRRKFGESSLYKISSVELKKLLLDIVNESLEI